MRHGAKVKRSSHKGCTKYVKSGVCFTFIPEEAASITARSTRLEDICTRKRHTKREIKIRHSLIPVLVGESLSCFYERAGPWRYLAILKCGTTMV